MRESRIWILALVVLIALAIGLAGVSSWPGGALSREWRILPVGLVILVCLFGIYVWSKTTEISELRGLVRGLAQRDDHPPDIEQLEKLFGMVQRSQQGYRDLIDTFEDLLFSVSLDGQIIAANRSCADLLGQPFSALVDERMKLFPASGEINRKLKDGKAAIERIEALYKPKARQVDHTDGLSVEFDNWRFNLRSSNTEPLVRLNVESRGDEALMRARTDELLRALGD